jgi:ankyrin repeat protein
LLGHGADPNAVRESGYSVLAAAIEKGNAETVRRLLEAGAAVDHHYFNRSMPEFAEYCRQPQIALMLRRSRKTRRAESGAAPDPARDVGSSQP